MRYLTPFQLFFWLQTITFVAYRAFFNTQTGAADVMSRDLLLVGGFMAVSLALLHARRRLPFLIHLVAATHVWAFLMVLLLVEYTLVPHVANLLLKWQVVAQPLSIGVFVTRSVQVILVFYLTRALQVIFGNPLGKAALKTVILFGLYQGFVSLVTLN